MALTEGRAMRPNTMATVLSLILFVASTTAFAQGWAPQKNVEIVAASGPGGSNDNTAQLP